MNLYKHRQNQLGRAGKLRFPQPRKTAGNHVCTNANPSDEDLWHVDRPLLLERLVGPFLGGRTTSVEAAHVESSVKLHHAHRRNPSSREAGAEKVKQAQMLSSRDPLQGHCWMGECEVEGTPCSRFQILHSVSPLHPTWHWKDHFSTYRRCRHPHPKATSSLCPYSLPQALSS